jgi:thymidine kinase
MKCGAIASYSYRKVPAEEQIMLGAKEVYEARCRRCYHRMESSE